ncbi:hypothetical protein EXS73_03165 [Candidatus Pacearchaeota archaeon]|nr:hypothetical protein [Candidatus Pacearchaeota archaeon]
MIKQTTDVENGLYLLVRENSQDCSIEICIPERVDALRVKEIIEDKEIVEIFRLDPSLMQREATYIQGWLNNRQTNPRVYRDYIKLREGLLTYSDPDKPCQLQYNYTQWNEARKEHLKQREQERRTAQGLELQK